MSKKSLNICIAAISAVIMLGAAFGLYRTELSRLDQVSQNESYIYCAKNTLELADAMGVEYAVYPVSFTEDLAAGSELSDDLRRMGEELQWLAEYNTDGSRLNRAADELSTSESVKQLGDGATYAEMCSAALNYHQAELELANSRASALSTVCIAVFAAGLAGLAYAAVKLSYPKEHSKAV